MEGLSKNGKGLIGVGNSVGIAEGREEYKGPNGNEKILYQIKNIRLLKAAKLTADLQV